MGLFDQTVPSRAGTTFTFVGNDADGLPIVGETFSGYPRVDSFKAELHWLGLSAESSQPGAVAAAPIEVVPIRFIGNRELQADGSWLVVPDPPRSQDGTFHVTVSLSRTGSHAVRIKGPSYDGLSSLPSEYLPWEVHVEGICPAGQLPLEDPPWLCGCAAGTQPLGGGGDSSLISCSPCAVGQLKERAGNTQCYSCLEAIVQERGSIRFAEERSVTAAPGASALHECGCSSGFFLSHIGRRNATTDLSTVCPPINADGFAERTRAFHPQCCNATASDCTSPSEKLCLKDACKMARLTTFQQQRQDLPNISGVCHSCSQSPGGLLMEGLDCRGGMHAIERLTILPDFWRANELSEDIKACKTPGACVGTGDQRTGVLDNICGPNRMGPYCEICTGEGNFYKDDSGNCTQCQDPLSSFSPESTRSWLPFVIFCSVTVLSFFSYIISKVRDALKDKPFTPLKWERLDRPPKHGHEFQNRRLRSELRKRGLPAPHVDFTKTEYVQFKLRQNMTLRHYIIAQSSDGLPFYYRPVDTSVEKKTLLSRTPLRHFQANGRFGQTRAMRTLRFVVWAVTWPIIRVVRAVTRIVFTIAGIIQKSAGKVLKFATKQKHKVKILLSMFQVMDGLQGSFNLVMPLGFLQLLENLNFLMFSLPLDCFVPTSFHITMVYRTTVPLIAELVLLAVAMFAGSRIPPVEFDKRRKPQSALMMAHMAGQKADFIREVLTEATQSGQPGQMSVPGFTPTPAQRGTASKWGLGSRLAPRPKRDASSGGAPSAAPGLPRPPAVLLPTSEEDPHVRPPSPPASPPDVGKGSERDTRMARYRELMVRARGREVEKDASTNKNMRRATTFLIIACLFNFYQPWAYLALAAAILIRTIDEADRRLAAKEGKKGSSLEQLKVKKSALKRMKRRFALARGFCLLCDVLAVLWMGIMAILGAVSVLNGGDTIPLYISVSLLASAGGSLLLIIMCTLTFILCDRQSFVIELKLQNITQLANVSSSKGEGDDQSSASSRSSRSGSSRSSRLSTRGREEKRLYWGGLQSQCIDACFTTLFLFYPSCSAITFQTFDCETFDDGTRFLRGDYSINCDTTIHYFMEMYAILMIVIWPIGVPIIYAINIYMKSGAFSMLLRIQAELRLQRREQEMRELLAKEEETFSSEYSLEEKISAERQAKRDEIKAAVDNAIQAAREAEEEEKRKKHATAARRLLLRRTPSQVKFAEVPPTPPPSPPQRPVPGVFSLGCRARVDPSEGSPARAAQPAGAMPKRSPWRTTFRVGAPKVLPSQASEGTSTKGATDAPATAAEAPPASSEEAGARRADGDGHGDDASAREEEKSSGDEQKTDDEEEGEGLADLFDEELELPTAYEEPDFMSQDRLDAMEKLTTFHELAGLELEASAGSIHVSRVWPTSFLSKDLVTGTGDRRDYKQYVPSLEERLVLTAYMNARDAELEARAMRLWLKETKQETLKRSLLLLLKPLGLESVDQALDTELATLRDDKDLGLSEERLDKFKRIVASKDLFLRMSAAERSSYVNVAARISTPKAGDELLAIITADSVRHDVRHKHAKEMSRPLESRRKKLSVAVREAFDLLDEDKSKMLDADELNEGFAALGINKADKQVRKLLSSISSGGPRQYSVFEFDRLVTHIRFAREETDEDRQKLTERAQELLRRSGTELVLTDPKADIVKLELKRGTGEPFVIDMHKGRAAFPLGSLVPFSPNLPLYVRSLTDAYKVEYKYWEIFECARKVTLVGAFILFGQGSLEQLLVGMMVCAVSIVRDLTTTRASPCPPDPQLMMFWSVLRSRQAVYNNIKPYDTWQNNVLQQFCQFNIFVMLLSGLVLRAMAAESPGAGFNQTSGFIELMLSVLTLLTTMLTLPAALLDQVPDPRATLLLYLRMCHRALKGTLKNARRLHTLVKAVIKTRSIMHTSLDDDKIVEHYDSSRAETAYHPQLDPEIPDADMIIALQKRDRGIHMMKQKDVRWWRYQRRMRVTLARQVAASCRPREASTLTAADERRLRRRLGIFKTSDDGAGDAVADRDGDDGDIDEPPGPLPLGRPPVVLVPGTPNPPKQRRGSSRFQPTILRGFLGRTSSARRESEVFDSQRCSTASSTAALPRADTGQDDAPGDKSSKGQSWARAETKSRGIVRMGCMRAPSVRASITESEFASNDMDDTLDAEEPVEDKEEEDDDDEEVAREIELEREVEAQKARIQALEEENSRVLKHSHTLETQTAREWSAVLRRQATATARPGLARLQLSEAVRMALPPPRPLPARSNANAESAEPDKPPKPEARRDVGPAARGMRVTPMLRGQLQLPSTTSVLSALFGEPSIDMPHLAPPPPQRPPPAGTLQDAAGGAPPTSRGGISTREGRFSARLMLRRPNPPSRTERAPAAAASSPGAATSATSRPRHIIQRLRLPPSIVDQSPSTTGVDASPIAPGPVEPAAVAPGRLEASATQPDPGTSRPAEVAPSGTSTHLRLPTSGAVPSLTPPSAQRQLHYDAHLPSANPPPSTPLPPPTLSATLVQAPPPMPPPPPALDAKPLHALRSVIMEGEQRPDVASSSHIHRTDEVVAVTDLTQDVAPTTDGGSAQSACHRSAPALTSAEPRPRQVFHTEALRLPRNPPAAIRHPPAAIRPAPAAPVSEPPSQRSAPALPPTDRLPPGLLPPPTFHQERLHLPTRRSAPPLPLQGQPQHASQPPSAPDPRIALGAARPGATGAPAALRPPGVDEEEGSL